MSELLQSKKFLSAVIGVVLLIVVNFLFADNPESAKELKYVIMGLFGIQIVAQGGADFGKEKAKAEKEKVALETHKLELEAEIAKVTGVHIQTPLKPGDTPWET